MREDIPIRLRYSVPEAAALLGVSKPTMWRRVHGKQIATVRDGSRVFITYDELHRYATRDNLPQAS